MALTVQQKGRVYSRRNTYPTCEFKYRVLDARRKEIRLMCIEPGSGPDDILRCTFRHVALIDDKPAYNTVSYVWGDSTKRASIFVDGKLLDIPQSSEKALRRIRKRDVSIVVWIDAVCINQNDKAERSQQVAMMADIYRNGATNFVVLGHDPPRSTKAALDSMRLLREVEIEDAMSDGTSFVDIVLNINGTLRWSLEGLSTEIDQSALAEFYSQPWFQ